MATPPTRRDALKTLGALAAASAAGCDGAVDPTIEDASLAPPTDTSLPGSPELQDPKTAIDTFVIMMMENRSFDHYFGALRLVEGRDDVDGLTADMSNPDADGAPVPVFRLPKECLEDPPHSWNASRAQLADGTNSGFVRAHQGGRSAESHEVMGYHDRVALPVYYALADEHALCDRWFAAVCGPTWPNRIYAYTATSNGMKTNDFSFVPFKQDSVFSRLTALGVSWRVYYHDVPFASLLQHVVDHPDQVQPIDQYFEDARAGRLPSVCFVEPGYTINDDHPPHAPLLGQVLVGSVYEALAQSPQWERSMFVIDYDEHGGFHDHVVPPTVDDAYAEEGFDQLGFRIPALVVSPYSRAEAVHTQFEHPSVIKHLGEVFGFEPLTVRDRNANPLWDCLDLDRMARRDPKPPTAVPVIDVDLDTYGSECLYTIHAGQQELDDALDRGLIPPHFDRRAEAGVTVDRVMLEARRLGVIRFRD